MYENLKKRFGQNFLVDRNILRKILKLIEKKNLSILEIGPGNGALTEFLIKSAPLKLTLIEIDIDLISDLRNKFAKYNNIEVIHGDFLKEEKILNKKFDLIVANLPYYISSQILIKLSTSQFRANKMILMFQKEFADRLIEDKLNSLNSIIKCFYKIKKKFEISKNSFYPPPKIKSTILEFTTLKKFLISDEEIKGYTIFKRNIFNKKRKKIGSIIKNYMELNISPELAELRAESIQLTQFIDLYKKVNP